MEVFKTTIKEEEVEFNDDFQIDPDEILNFCLTFNSLNNPTIDELDNNNDLFGAIKLENVEEQLVDDPPKLDCLLCEKIFSTSPNLFKHFQSWIHQAKEAGLYKKVFKMEVPDICSVPNYKLDTFYPDIKKEKIDDDQQVPISMPKLDTQEYPGTDSQTSLFQFDPFKDPVTSHQNNLIDFSAFKYPEIDDQQVPISMPKLETQEYPGTDNQASLFQFDTFKDPETSHQNNLIDFSAFKYPEIADQQVPINMPKLETEEYPGTDNQTSLFQFDTFKDPVTRHENNLCDFSAFKYPEIADQQVPISMPKLDTQEYPGTDNQTSLFQFDRCKDSMTSHENNPCDFSAFKYPEIRNQVVPTSSCQFNNNYVPQIDLPTNQYYFNHQTNPATDQVVPQSSYQYQNVDYCYPPLIPFYEPEFSYSNFLAPTYSLFSNFPQPVNQLPLFLPFQFNNDKNSIQQNFLDVNNNNLHQTPIGHSTKSYNHKIDKTSAPKSIPEVKIKEEPLLEFPIQIKVEKNANDEYDIIFEDYKYEFATEQLQPPKKKRNVSQKMYYNIEDVFKCTFCSKEYSTSSNLIRHMNLHLNAKIYKCPYCPSSFQQQEYWKKHTDTHRRNRILNNVNSKLM